MFSAIFYVLIWIVPVLFHSATCFIDPPQPYLSLYIPTETPYLDIFVRKVGDNLTLVCELKGDAHPAPRKYAWSYVSSDNSTDEDSRPYTVSPRGPTLASRLTRQSLTLADSGHYICNSPPYTVTKFVLVQTREAFPTPSGPRHCSPSAFVCGDRCINDRYLCDGFVDCPNGEDEQLQLCMHQPCERPDKLNCSSGRCISAMACVVEYQGRDSCCNEYPRYSRLEGYMDVEYPPLFEDRHAPDEYGFIQSTIYTVTACALIFMIAVVLLVSAICKMHMKRAALRSYTQHERAQRHRYTAYEPHRFPPCYEASRLLEQQRLSPAPPSPPGPPPLQCSTECGQPAGEPDDRGFGLARLSAIFSSRYRQVPTQCLDVEMTDVRSTSCNSSPTRNQTRTRLDHYRSPTYCDLNTDLFFNPEVSNCGRDLNYMATPMEFFRRRTLRNVDLRPRSLTLQLGRFQLSIPRLGRRQSLERRPDTPNVAEINIDDLDFVRLDGNETYTLNGRTIRLLGANFENYPMNDGSVRPPPYTEAMRYKLYGPPPEYLSRDTLNNERDENTNTTEVQARQNIEMPPCYDELASGVDSNANARSNSNVTTPDNVNSVVTSNINNATTPDNVNSVVTSNVNNAVTPDNVNSVITSNTYNVVTPDSANSVGISNTNNVITPDIDKSVVTSNNVNNTSTSTPVTPYNANIVEISNTNNATTPDNAKSVVTSNTNNVTAPDNANSVLTSIVNTATTPVTPDNANSVVTITATALTESSNNEDGNSNNVTNVTKNVMDNVTNTSITNVGNNVTNSVIDNVTNSVENISSIIDNLPAIDSDINANETDNRYNVSNVISNKANLNNDVC